MKDNSVIDTNILFYAIDQNSPKHERAKNFISEMGDNKIAIPVRVLAECYNLALKKNQAEARDARIFVESLKNDPEIEIISSSERSLENALRAEENFWGRLIEETALDNGYETIYTENVSDFEKIEAINPLE